MHSDSMLSLIILVVLFFVLPSLFKILGKYTLGTKDQKERDDEEGEVLPMPQETKAESPVGVRHGEPRRRHRGFRKPSGGPSLPSAGADERAGMAAGYSAIEPGRNEESGPQAIANKPIKPGWF